MLYVATALCTVHKVFMKYSHIKKTIIFYAREVTSLKNK